MSNPVENDSPAPPDLALRRIEFRPVVRATPLLVRGTQTVNSKSPDT